LFSEHIMSQKTIYLDHAATTAPDPTVIEAVSTCMRELTANPSAPYSAAGRCIAKINEVKKICAGMIHARPQEIFFTSGGTESNNWALRQAKHAVVSAIEHKSILVSAKAQGCDLRLVRPNKQGMITAAAVEAALTPETELVSVQLVNNETGVIQPVGEIGALCKKRGILFHCDAVAAFGTLPIDVSAMHIDLLSVSAHKYYGPRGIGFMYAKQGLRLSPLIAGGDQENGRRGGTENIPGICGMGVAAALVNTEMNEKYERLTTLRAAFIEQLLNSIPGIEIIGEESIPGIISLRIPGVNNEHMIAELDRKGILVSGGAACNSASHAPSHVLMAMGLNEKAAFEVIRISMGRHTTMEEMNVTAKAIADNARK
jgi:cysteine desulfurase